MNSKKILYCYPTENDDNLYITSCRRVWETAGYVVNFFPNRFSGLMNFKLFFGNTIVLNWFEDRLGLGGIQILSFFKSIILLLVIRCTFKKVIWVRHNLKPHNNYSPFFYDLLLRILDQLSDVTVTHRNVKELNSCYIPHPLYPIDDEIKCDVKDVDYLYFGLVKPYKDIDLLLEGWPVDQTLVMAGYCNDIKYEEKLKKIIFTRKLKVTWRNEFLDYNDLCVLISKSKCVVLPHSDGKMIVSGAFYQAVSLGVNVLIRDGEFFKEYLRKFDFVHSFNINDIESSLSGLVLHSYDHIQQVVQSEFSDHVIAERWNEVISK